MHKCKFSEIANQICNKKSYKYLTFLGNGAFKETFLIESNSIQYALKIVDPKKINFERLKREINSIAVCDSQYIAKIYEVDSLTIEGINYYYFLEGYLSGGTLTDRIENGNLTKHQIFEIASYLLTAIKCLLENNLVHRDIKPDNIMFTKSGIPVLVDFGLVRDLNDFSLTKTWQLQGPGTPLYSSPEQLKNKKHLITWKSDQFSLGIVLSMILTGYHPYSLQNYVCEEIIYNVSERKGIQQWFDKYINDHSLFLLAKMLEPWPIRRYNCIDKLLHDVKKEL